MLPRARLLVPCALLALASGLTISPRARAAPTSLICQGNLAKPDCTEVKGSWPASSRLHVIASCQECTGSGSNITCSQTEQVTAQRLLLEKQSNVKVTGSFSKVKLCIGKPLFRFSKLVGAGAYQLTGNFPSPHGRTILFKFNISGSTGSVTDAGKGGGGGSGDSGSGGGGGGSGDGGSGGGGGSGDGGSGSGGSGGGGSGDGGSGSGVDDGGCCSVGSSTPYWPSALALLMLVVLRRRDRRTRDRGDR